MSSSGYRWSSERCPTIHGVLLPRVIRILEERNNGNLGRRVFDLGCGNGSVANRLSQLGWDVSGVDVSEEGIRIANSSFPHLNLHVGSAYDDLSALYGQFPLVLSLEVVEHVYSPREYAKTLHSLVEPGGTAIISTPYHGYIKNLALALTGKFDKHFTALWDHGHIKFWSRDTLSELLHEAGFTNIRYVRVGRIPPIAKSMIAIAQKT